MVGNRDAVGIASQIIEDFLGSSEGRFGIHHPFEFLAGLHETGKSVGSGQRFDAAMKLQLSVTEGRRKRFQEQPAIEA